MHPGSLFRFAFKAYEKWTLWATNEEHHRTQSQFDRWFTYKYFFMEFVNFYLPIATIVLIHAAGNNPPGGNASCWLESPGVCLTFLQPHMSPEVQVARSSFTVGERPATAALQMVLPE